MTMTYAQYINYEMERLVNYINHIAEFNNSYNKALKDLCSKSKNGNITKSEETIKFEKGIKESYDKAMELYNDLKRIADKYRSGMNIDSDVHWFNSRLNDARLPIYEKATLELKTEGRNLYDGIPTGGAAEINNNKNNDKKLQEYLVSLYNDYKGIENPIDTIMYAVGTFLTNYFELKDANTIGADKYFHARANYEAAQHGTVGELIAKIISDLRELTDGYRNINEKGYSKSESEKDIEEDQNANYTGRILGRNHPLRPAYELLKKYMPNGFPERYKSR